MRPHLFEFEDFEWLPATIRDLGTDWVRFFSERFIDYRPVVSRLSRLLEESRQRRIFDLCSGSDGGWLAIQRELDALGMNEVEITLSDKYPNIRGSDYVSRASSGRIDGDPQPVDVLESDWQGAGVRTMLLSLHHFRPADAQAILQKAVASRSSVAIFDVTGLDFIHKLPRLLLPVVLPPIFLLNVFAPIAVILFTPHVRPFSWKRLVFTYVIPIVPLYVWWDATVSMLRAYTVSEIQTMLDRLEDASSFRWDVGRAGGPGPRAITYLIGYPKPIPGESER